MIKAVLFDFDDTLAKTKVIRYKAIKEAGKTFYNIDITDKDIDQHWGKPFNTFLSDVFRNLADIDILTKNFKSILHKYPNEPFTNTDKVLNQLRKKYLLAIISSSHPALILSGISEIGMTPEIFFFIQSSEDTTVHKPYPDVFLPSIEKLKVKGINKSEILYVGDAIEDYQASSNAGLHFCGIADRSVEEKIFIERKIPYIKNIEELPFFIEKL